MECHDGLIKVVPSANSCIGFIKRCCSMAPSMTHTFSAWSSLWTRASTGPLRGLAHVSKECIHLNGSRCDGTRARENTHHMAIIK